MQDDFENTAESPVVSSARLDAKVRFEMLDVSNAIMMAERATGSRIFGDEGKSDLDSACAEASALAERGERAALLGAADALAASRQALRAIASSRYGVVAHAIAGHGSEELAALTDLGWGVLCASGPEDSFDLTLVARRAAEDSGVPFVVVHGLGRVNHPAGRAVAMVGIPHDRGLHSFVGPRVKLETATARSISSDRAFAERVPFALGAALREYGAVSGRRHDAFDKIPLGESPLVLVGIGPVGDALFSATTELRARGYDVGAVHITSLRPFPGPRLVKALARALAVTILEPADEPLAHGALLARDVKSAFTDALTWVPGFPGIGRIPKLFVGASGSVFDVTDLASVCENMLADERGRRVFSFVDVDHALPRAAPPVKRDSTPPPADRPEREISFRFVLDDVPSADAVLSAIGTVLVGGVGLRTQGIITAAATGAGATLDVFASRDHARGVMARRPPRLVIATERGVSSAGAVVALADNAILGVLGVDPSGTLPEATRSVVRERRARVLPLPTGDGGPTTVLAATCAGAALAAAARLMKTPLDGAGVSRVMSESMPGPDAEIHAQRGRRAFEATCDVLDAVSREADLRPIGMA